MINMGSKQSIYNYLSEHPEYRANVDLYNPDMDEISLFKDRLEGIEIKIFSASWCPDCRLQVPRFISVMLALEKEDLRLQFIDMNRKKKDSMGEAEKFNVFVVPTFLFLRDGEEIGRIIESPKKSIEGDIAEIVG